LDELLKHSDFVVLTCAYSPEMKELINKETLSKMKRNAVLINTSRGALINQDDLYAALSSGQIRAAGLDVTMPEPLPPDNPLFSLSNCVILPHIGSATERARTEMLHIAEDGILGVLDGPKLPQHLRVV
uniref:2-Hacid_dh_C domain-containing protein n=1 Tax=Gongylonema pulchrum TaxID=637853 RepID=A0A183ELG0_9BILA